MKISFTTTLKELVVSKGDRTIAFGKMRPKGDGLFIHLNNFWKSLPDETTDTLMDLYEEAYDLLVVDVSDNIGERLGEITQTLLDDIHSYDAIKPFVNDTVSPENAPATYENNSKHHTPERTYTIPEYEELAILSVRLRALLPLMAADEMYINQNAGSGASMMYKTLRHMNAISTSECYTSEPFERLKLFIHATAGKLMTADVNLAGTILDGVGSEELPFYLEGISVILGCICTTTNTRTDNVVKQINRKLNCELGSKITTRFNVTDTRSFVNIAKAEQKEPDYLATYQAREQVPNAVPLACGVWGQNYRVVRQSLGMETPPSVIKEYIDSLMANPLPELTQTHICLLKIVIFDKILIETIRDIPARHLVPMLGVAQAWFMENKLPALARIISSKALLETRNRTLKFTPKIYNPLSNDKKELLDRYYRIQIANNNGRTWERPYMATLDATVADLKRYTWETVSTDAVNDLLGTRNGRFTPTSDVVNDMAVALAITLANARKSRDSDNKMLSEVI